LKVKAVGDKIYTRHKKQEALQELYKTQNSLSWSRPEIAHIAKFAKIFRARSEIAPGAFFMLHLIFFTSRAKNFLCTRREDELKILWLRLVISQSSEMKSGGTKP